MGRTRDRVDGIWLLRYPQRPARGLAGYLFEYGPSMLFTAALALYARTRGPFDVVHGCNPPDLFWLFGLVARWQGGAYVFDQHDVGPELAERREEWTASHVGRLTDRTRDGLLRRLRRHGGRLPPVAAGVSDAPDHWQAGPLRQPRLFNPD